MIISRTPYRVSFFGGGTDYPAWYEEHGGAVLATSINRYCYLTCRHLPPFFEHKSRVVYSRIEDVKDIADIQHPAIRASLQFLRMTDGLEIHHDGDLPARAGLGSSSSFTVGLLNALHALRGEMPTRRQLAQEAIHVERDLIGENVGCQDQVTAACGGFNLITFAAGDQFTIQPVTISAERRRALQDRLLLFFTGFARTASEIAAEQIRNTPRRGAELRALRQLVDEGLRLLAGTGDLREIGKLLHEGWQLKRALSARISTPLVDELYERARRAGALGGKLLGAGGGGFLLLFAEPDAQPAVRERLADLLHVPFAFETLGTQIIFYEPGPDHAAAAGRPSSAAHH